MFTVIKRFLYSLLLVVISLTLRAQNEPTTQTAPPGAVTTSHPTPPQLTTTTGKYNYIRYFTPQVPITDSGLVKESSTAEAVKKTTSYLDGFQRKLLDVNQHFVQVENTWKHLYQPYDNRFQRNEYSYLPYTSSVGGFSNGIFTDQKIYHNNMYPDEGGQSFGVTEYESGTNYRRTKTYAPGKSRVGQAIGTTVQGVVNNTNEIARYEDVNIGSPFKMPAAYNAKELIGEKITDNEGAETTHFKTRDGRLVCTRQLLSTGVYAYTYYVYDMMDRLTYIVTPQGHASGVFSNLIVNDILVFAHCYQYKYNDAYGRMNAFSKPGETGFHYIVYDQKDRPIMRRTPSMGVNNQWEVTFYDGQDRVKAVALLSSSNAVSYWQNEVNTASPPIGSLLWYLISPEGEMTYPPPSGISGVTILGYTYYDQYDDGDPDQYNDADHGGNLFTTYSANQMDVGELSNIAGAEIPQRTNRVHGMSTGSRERIMAAPGTALAATDIWIKTAAFYDDKGRPIYMAAEDDQTNGFKEYAASQFNFSGNLLQSKYKAKQDWQEFKELVVNEFDAVTGRLKSVKHKVNDRAMTSMTSFEYDGMGRVRRQFLGRQAEVRDYRYNIRGQLRGINDVYAEIGDDQGGPRTFGESLKYDYGYMSTRLDNRPAGMIWRGSNKDRGHSYGYDYDLGGRFLSADYQYKDSTEAWSNFNYEYSVNNMQYDINGNIKRMYQKGAVPTPHYVDQLTYNYDLHGQLVSIKDDVTFQTGWGDFYDDNTTGADYSYDASGNLEKDLNKNITNVDYNYRNLPVTVTFGNGDKIEYAYTASGRRYQEKVTESGKPTKFTDYRGLLVLDNNYFIYASNPYGRTMVYDPLEIKEEYWVKDHLGNIRSVINAFEFPVLDYMASYEVASANIEGQLFTFHNEVRDNKPGSTTLEDSYSGRLNGADPDRRIGSSMLLYVMAGDQLELNVNNFYEDYDKNGDVPVSASSMIGTLISTLTAGVGGIPGEMNNPAMVSYMNSPANISAIENIMNTNTDSSRPKAYLNCIFFDETMNVIPGKSVSFQANGNGSWTQIGTTSPIRIDNNGYVLVHLTNITDVPSCYVCGDVFFDQLNIRFMRGKLMDETHYYPFGLPMGGIGGQPNPNGMPYRQKYQGNEYIQDMGLNWMNFHNRQLGLP